MKQNKIIRTPTSAKGGLTEAEREQLKDHAKLWTRRIMRTDQIEPQKIVPAIKRLYEVSGLKEPRVVIVPSPYVARLAGGIAAAVWHLRGVNEVDVSDATNTATYFATITATNTATDAATDDATRDATTYAATRAATDAATDAATYAATRAATGAATRDATEAPWLKQIIQEFTPNNEKFTLGCIEKSWRMQQGGNHWGQYDCFLSSMRDVLGLTGLDCWEKYEPWEQAAIHGSWRIMHPEFCMVSDFPEVLLKDEQNRPHCDSGPSHRWRDGFEIYHLDGVRLERDMWSRIVSGDMPFKDVMGIEDADIRALAIKYNAASYLDDAELLDEHRTAGRLYKLTGHAVNTVTEFAEMYLLRMECPSTGRVFIEGVEPDYARQYPYALHCQAYNSGVPVELYEQIRNHG